MPAFDQVDVPSDRPRGGLERLGRGDLIQLAAAIVFGVSLFLSWYETDARNPLSNIEGERGAVSAWAAHPVLRFIFLAAVIAAFISAWQTIRAHQLGWRRGEMASVVSVVVAGLVLFEGLIDRPGEPAGTIGLDFGWFVAMAAALVAVVASMARLPGKRRKPPGM